jgi:HAD superfamily hydrolase (TIGR01549 family)
MSTIRGVIFDVDGTLIDSNDAHARAWVDALTEAGYGVPFEQVRRLIGMGGDKLMPEIIGVEKESPQGSSIAERRSALFRERYLSTVRPFPRVVELLQRLQDDSLTLVVASSAQADELSDLLEIAHAADYFRDTTSSSDAEHSKPDPDIVQAALDRMQYKPDEVVMIGDTPYDIEAAGKAGVALIALRCGGWNDQELDGAFEVYDDPADLLTHYTESPFGRRTLQSSEQNHRQGVQNS